ncbi:MAG: DUF2029 domain-containing protein [Candidatus Sumerlaeia bacterium]|nr:DUF2029 domain-containing protein [Candidatus Sumerlaeia bacterium]
MGRTSKGQPAANAGRPLPASPQKIAPASKGTSATVWLLAGLLAAYVPFLLVPVFFNRDHVMNEVCPVFQLTTVGMDLDEILKFSRSWWVEGNTPYIRGNTYPPLEAVFFVPLLGMNFHAAYAVLTLISAGCFLLITWMLPVLMEARRRLTPAILFFVGTGMFSHGLLFELERGQFNVIAMALCLAGVYLFHFQRRWRPAAYALFTLSVQLKVYPAIFVFLLVDRWRDWKINLKRAGLIGAANFACLFILGPGRFVEFVTRTIQKMSDPSLWPGNHSIHCFSVTAQQMLHIPGALLSPVLYLATLALLATIMVLSVRRNWEGFHPHLLVGCTIGALIIPSLSHDYTLSFLPAPLAMFFSRTWSATEGTPRELWVWKALVFLIALAYSTTVFSIIHKEAVCGPFFSMATPALLLILLAATMLFVMDKPHATVAKPIAMAGEKALRG